MQLCEAKYRPWDERRKKGCGCARRHVPEKRKASLADNRAKNAALSAFRRPFLRKIASRCSTGSVPRRVERSGRRRPPCRSDRGRNPCSQADWRKSRAFPPIRMHLPCREAAFPHSACSCPAENRSVELCRPCVLSFFDFCFATLFPIIYNKGGFLRNL